MSNQNGSAENSNQTSGQETEKPEINTNEASNSNEDVNRGDQRYKNDLIRYKKEKQEIEEKLNALLREKEEREFENEQKKGNFAKVIDELKAKNIALEQESKKRDLMIARNNVNQAIKEQAIKNGCKDPDVFLRLIGTEMLKEISFDENFRPDLEEVTKVFEEAKKTYEHIGLFSVNVNIADKSPSKNGFMPKTKKTENDIYEEYFKKKGWR